MITSRRNSIVQRVRAVARGAHAAPAGLCFVEGVRLVEEWLRSELAADAILVGERLGSTERGRALLKAIEDAGHLYHSVADGVLDSISNVRHHQSIAAAIHTPSSTLAEVMAAPCPLVVALVGLQDPGNVGTILRTAHAAGAHGAVVTAGGVSPFNAKCIRASAGSALHLPLVAGVTFDDFEAACRGRGLQLLACCPSGGTSYLDADLTVPAALVFGQEGAGLPQQIERRCDHVVSLPTRAGVDSLNVAASAAVLLYEAARQRAGLGAQA